MDSGVHTDRLSSLPKNIRETILMCLLIRDAVRTSVLSSGWRYEWSTLPRLVIDKQSFRLSKGLMQTEFDRKFVEGVNRILLLHQGPLNQFKLSTDLVSHTDFDGWILFLSRNGIKEFTLDLRKERKRQPYKLPSCLFSCEDITYLELYGCIFIPPASFGGFHRLTVMHLQYVTITDNGLAALLSLCPLLKTLVLKHLTGCTHLNISAQKLVDLTIECELDDIHFKSTPLLATASICLLNEAYDSSDEDEGGCKIVEVLGYLPRIRKLELLYYTLQHLAVGDIPVCLPASCPAKHLVMDIDFEDARDILAALCIFRSSPVMEKLSITVTYKCEGYNFWGEEEDFNCTFSCLQAVELTDFFGYTSELKFVRLVLANAPVLETLHIKFSDDISDELEEIFRALIRYPRASPKAELFVPAKTRKRSR